VHAMAWQRVYSYAYDKLFYCLVIQLSHLFFVCCHISCDQISSCGPCIRTLTKPRRWRSRAISCIHHAVSVYHSFGNIAEHNLHTCSIVYLSEICQHSSKIRIRNSPIRFWCFRRVIGSGSLSTTSPGHTIRYIKRFG
jgi:hypothetical protein